MAEPLTYAQRLQGQIPTATNVGVVDPNNFSDIYDLQGYDDFLMAEPGRFVLLDQVPASVGGATSGGQIMLQGIDTRELKNACIQNAKIQDLAVTTAKIEDAAIDSAKIEDLSVTTAKIDDLAVTNAKVGLLAVDTANIVDAAIENAKIGLLAVDTAQIADAAIENAKIGLLAVDTAQIASAAITNAKIDNLAVTNAKINDLSASKINAGTMSFNYASGGTLTLGGSGNGNGLFRLNNSGGTQIIEMSNAGLIVKSGGTFTWKDSGDHTKVYIYNGGFRACGDGSSVPAISLFENYTDLGNNNHGVRNFVDTVSSRRYLYWQSDDSTYGYAWKCGSESKLTMTEDAVNIYGETTNTRLQISNDNFFFSVGGVNRVTIDKIIELHYSGYVSVSTAGGATGSSVVTHSLGHSNYYVMLSNDQTSGGYMDFVTMSWVKTSSTQITIYWKNHSSSTASGRIWWHLFHT